jgi:hypothetical protein
MKALLGFVMVALVACSGTSGQSGPEACVAAGGKCILGGNTCSNPGPQDCNPDRNAGGAFCCLSCSGDAAGVCGPPATPAAN